MELSLMLAHRISMKSKLKWIFAALLACFGLLQLTNPARTNPPVVSDMMATNAPPPPVAALFRAACYDCHSHETKWPWYSHVAPASWLVVNDVNEGRHHLNLSDWPDAHPDWQVRRLENMSDQIQSGDMPPKKYAAIHADARLTASQRKEMAGWLDARAAQLKAAAGK
jgi:hypothetical protein